MSKRRNAMGKTGKQQTVDNLESQAVLDRIERAKAAIAKLGLRWCGCAFVAKAPEQPAEVYGMGTVEDWERLASKTPGHAPGVRG